MPGISFADLDWFADEASDFDRRVHLLTFGTLQASLEYLSVKSTIETSNLSQQFDATQNSDVKETILNDLAVAAMYLQDQQRFIRNMALVALSSQFTHALNNLARHAETFVPRIGDGALKLKGKRPSEYGKLWHKYKVRFGIDFSGHESESRTGFTEIMGAVRNQVVHVGGDANEWNTIKYVPSWSSVNCSSLSLQESRRLWKAAEEEFKPVDCHFSESYPEFVEGDSRSATAQVRVTEDQLEMFRSKSVDLIFWLAKELQERATTANEIDSGSA